LGDVATALGIGLTSDALSDADLSEAQEAFVIGMPYCVLPVASLEERSLELAPGPLTRRLIEAWSRRVGLDLLEQIAGSLSSGRTPPAVGGPRRREQVSSTIVIPARLRSSRLAEKVLAEIDGRTMIEHVYDVAVRAATGPVLVLTDSEAVEQVVRGFGGEVWMTGPEHESGTARIASVAQMLESDVVVNLQGDAPLIDPELVAEAVQQASSSSAAVTMPVYPIADPEQLRDPSVVKVVRAQDGRVLYCSRSVVPFFRDGGDDSGEAGSFWGHPGLYAYRREFLRTFHKLPASPLEGAERLEQLRWLEAGVRIHSFVTRPQHTSVDTAADLDEVRRAYADRVAS
jgi:3-deoxy-manno-octulosonate cytidylyltransferase (CMP-KDO synthetase)